MRDLKYNVCMKMLGETYPLVLSLGNPESGNSPTCRFFSKSSTNDMEEIVDGRLHLRLWDARSMFAVEYPGMVQNERRAVLSLGGEIGIAEVRPSVRGALALTKAGKQPMSLMMCTVRG